MERIFTNGARLRRRDSVSDIFVFIREIRGFKKGLFNHEWNEFSRMGRGCAAGIQFLTYSCSFVKFVVQKFSGQLASVEDPRV
jgi:hypothetical protein